MFGAAVGELGIEGIEEPIELKLESTCAAGDNIVGDPIIIHISLGLIKLLLLIIETFGILVSVPLLLKLITLMQQ